MIVADVISALGLPPESRVERRVPKTLLVERAATTAADKRQINAGIEELQWLAALKPANVGVPEYRDEAREVLEIAVLSLLLRPDAKSPRLTELVHRAVPYPLLLIAAQADERLAHSPWDGVPRPSPVTDGLGRPSHESASCGGTDGLGRPSQQSATLTLSLAEKRLSLGEAGKVVLEGAVTSCVLADDPGSAVLVKSLALTAQPRTDLWSLYRGWVGCLEAFQAARLTGRFAVAPNTDRVFARREALAAHERLQREIAQLRAAANREAQINRRVELNLAVKRLEGELAAALAEM